MAKIIHTPDIHDCHTELANLGPQPLGTIAECSCEKRYQRHRPQLNGELWVSLSEPHWMDKAHRYTSHLHPCCGKAPVETYGPDGGAIVSESSGQQAAAGFDAKAAAATQRPGV